MRYTFTIEIPDKRGSHENDHVDFLKAASKQMEETLDYATCREGETSHGQVEGQSWLQ